MPEIKLEKNDLESSATNRARSTIDGDLNINQQILNFLSLNEI